MRDVGVKATHMRMKYIIENDGLPSISKIKKEAHEMQHTTTSESSGRGVSEGACKHAARTNAHLEQKGVLATVRTADR